MSEVTVLYRQASFDRREVQVLDLLAAGRTYAEIAAELQISVDTVKSRLKRTYVRLGAANGPHAVALALSGGLIPRRTGSSR